MASRELGSACPRCPFWAGRDRRAGLPVDEAAWLPPSRKALLTYVTDLRHFLDDGDLPDLPGPAMALAPHQGAIVEWMTMVLPADTEVTNVHCRRRPHRRRCDGRIEARFLAQGDAIAWRCPPRGDHGVISGWIGTRWDRSEFLTDASAVPN